ncbi:MAG: hypothetical protein SOZ80_03590 [Prevotella sp.]|uniref:hypothetical protein n=1 Tax=Prevotella sp. TaxID=59823 RepID=UPI002A300ACF|nr:hypothetical protein [Prevotella sp.]MDD7317242.1 hypothetical protein [Prevotellaceae bacterium]MDY4019846.1 hypothetical protein [Prevotella sp.]
MKKIYFFAALAFSFVAFASCTDSKNKGENKEGDSTEQNVSNGEEGKKIGPMGSFTSPEGTALKDVDNIEYVLYPHSYKSAMEAGEDIKGKTTIYYKDKVADSGEKNTELAGTRFRYPNNLLIPIYKDAKAKKGDIVLTWWQSGSGMKRAIVTDDSDPTMPKVHYLDLSFKGDGSGFAEEHDNEQLKPNSFVVLKDGEFQPGAPLAIKNKGELVVGILIKEVGDKVIYLGFAGSLNEIDKSEVKLLPLKPNYGVGDNVKSVFVDAFTKDAKVTKIDSKIGRVWVKEGDKEKILNIFEVMK